MISKVGYDFGRCNLTPVKSPCKDCAYRYVGCHSECEDYFQFKKNVDETRAAMIAYRKQNSDATLSFMGAAYSGTNRTRHK